MSYRFTIDTNFKVTSVETENVRSFRVRVNDGDYVENNENFSVKENDNILIKLSKNNGYKDSKIVFKGYDYTEAESIK